MNATLKFNPNHEPAGSSEGGQFSSGGGDSSVQFGERAIPITYDDQVTTRETAQAAQQWIQRIPASERAKSTVKNIEIYDNPEDVTRRLDALGIETDAMVNGAFDFSTHTLYASVWDGEKNSARTLLHEIGHSIVGLDEEMAESWAQNYLRHVEQPKSLGSALLLKEVRARELWPQYLERLKSNDCHNPTGSPEGGQFCGGQGSSGESAGTPYAHLNNQPINLSLLRREERKFNVGYGQNEHGAIVKDGRVIIVKGTNPENIPISHPPDVLQGSIVTHTHPDLSTIPGGHLSMNDLLFAAGNNVKEMRAVTSTHIYSITSTLGDRWYPLYTLEAAFKSSNDKARTEVYANQKDYPTALKMLEEIQGRTWKYMSTYVEVRAWKR